jgi:hypothetical protein
LKEFKKELNTKLLKDLSLTPPFNKPPFKLFNKLPSKLFNKLPFNTFNKLPFNTFNNNPWFNPSSEPPPLPSLMLPTDL